jgi:hypothetical protein
MLCDDSCITKLTHVVRLLLICAADQITIITGSMLLNVSIWMVWFYPTRYGCQTL